jgi:hypothetical protein
MLTSSSTTKPTPNREFSTPEAKIVKENSSITPTQNTQLPLTVTLPEKQVKVEDVQKRETITYGGQIYYYRKVNIVATHYTNSVSDCGNTKGITASGVRASRGTIAVPKSISFGTEIILEDEAGNKQKVVAQDRGGAIKWLNEDTMKIDVFVPNATKRQLLQLGVKHYTGYILEKVD